MKSHTVEMRKEFVEDFVQWMKKNNIKVTEPYELKGIWRIMYMPNDREQRAKCKLYIEYQSNNDLM